MKNFKKLSFFIVFAIIVNLFTGFATISVSAAENNVLYKSGFVDYTKGGRPSGWVEATKIVTTSGDVKSETDCDKSDIEPVSDAGHGNTIKITASTDKTIKDIIPFNKVISSGKLHISFDGKRSDKTSTSKAFVTLFNVSNSGKYVDGTPEISNYNPYDVNDFRGSAGYHASQFLRINYSDGSVYASNNGLTWLTQLNTGKKIEANKWYHTDMIIDLDAHRYEVWIDGDKITSNMKNGDDIYTYGSFDSTQGRGAFKGFGILHQDNTDKSGEYDNICITHYTNDDKIEMIAEPGSNGIGPDATDGKYLNVSLNDWLSADFRDDDFEIKDANGISVTGVKVSTDNKTKSGCVLDFSAASGLKANTEYTVTYKPNVNGTATGVSASGASAVFRTNALVVDTSAEGYKYYYTKENFDNFTDKTQLPYGFYAKNFNDTLTGTHFNKYLSAEAGLTYGMFNPSAGINGNVLEILNNGNGLYHFFPRGVVAGNFTTEFDVKYTGGGWSIGMIPYRSWENALLNNSSNKLNRLHNYRVINALVGMSQKDDGTDISSPNLAICNAVTDYSQPTMSDAKITFDTGLDINPNEWAHIKLDFDMADGKVDISVMDKDGKTETKNDLSYGDWNKFGSGVEGLVFSAIRKESASTNKLYIDNLEVYTADNKLLNQDFNGYNSPSATRFPYFWISDDVLKSANKDKDAISASSQKPTANENAYSVNGKTDNTNDKAVKLTGKKNDGQNGKPLWYTTRFNQTVPAGESYAVEFDLNREDEKTVWSFGPVDSTRVTPLIGYNDQTATANNADDFLTNTNLLMLANDNLYSYNKKSTQIFIGATASETNLNNFFTKLTTDDSQKVNEWHHYKVVAVPQATNTKYIVTVDNDTSKKFEFTDKLDNNKKDIAGIAFQIRNIDNFNNDWGITLDNVQAYLCDDSGTEITKARENTITDISVEKENGNKISVKDSKTLPYSTKKIIVSFSEKIDETKKDDITAINLANSAGATGTTKGIYDCIEDVIQLRSEYAAYPMNYTSEIDGNKYIITLTDKFDEGKKYSLNIAKNVRFDSSPYSTLDNGYSMTFSGAFDPDSDLELSECTLVLNTGTTESPVWKPVLNYDEIPQNEASLGIEFKATNESGSTQNVRAIAAFYNETGAISALVNIAVTDQAIESHANTQTIYVPLNIDSFTNGESYTRVKVFAWDADTMKPLLPLSDFTSATSAD